MSRLIRFLSGRDRRVASRPRPLRKLLGRKNGVSSVCPLISPTLTSFCPYSPTPSVSSSPGANGTFGATGTGLVWAIEDAYSTPNCGLTNNGHKVAAVLHAFNAASMSELYNSSHLQTTLGLAVSFSTPTVFQGRVYIATNTNGIQGEVDVFGLCSPTCLH
jgi:hypothetical protein